MTIRMLSKSIVSHGYGWNPDIKQQQDAVYNASLSVLKSLPSAVDLREYCPLIYDQGPIGSCTSNAICAAIQFDQMKQGLPSNTPSRLFVYYNERMMERTIASDAGARIKDGIKSVHKVGACSESDWPYLIDKFAEQPPTLCYQNASKQLVKSYHRVIQNAMQIKSAIAQGFPVIFGCAIYTSFESQTVAGTGVVPTPASNEELIGGHCMLAVGYLDARQAFIVRNSWGKDWGVDGYCVMPYSYFLDPNMSSDFWVLNSIS